MAAWYVLALIVALAWGTDARAQAPLSTAPKGPAGQPSSFATPPPPTRKGECALLPGGKAPVGPIADLSTPLSPRSLDLVYFGKRLHDLTQADFQRMAELSKRCPPGENILRADRIEKLKEVIREAQTAREATIAWGKQRMVEVGAIPVGRQRLTRLNDLWIELEAHEGQMTREDVDGLAAWIAREQQAIYDAAPRWHPNRPAIVVMPIAALPAAPGSAAMGLAGSPILSIGRPRLPGGEEE